MSLETIMQAIEAEGEAALARLQEETAVQVRSILAEAEAKAAEAQNAITREAAATAVAEYARLLHEAETEAMQITAAAREEIVTDALDRTRRRLAQVRDQPDYPAIWRQLTLEAIAALGEAEARDAILAIDPRDEALVAALPDNSLTIDPSLHCWGGVVIRSRDGRITISNTLESRLERAAASLRREIAASFDA